MPLPPARRTIVLIGGSVRAAAQSALRAGFTPFCIDLFADVDLQAIAATRQVSHPDYPRRLPELIREAPPGPVLYTGGLENHPRIIARIARERTVWGNGASVLRVIRDPFFIARLLREHDLPALTVSRKGLPETASVKKPLHGAGGTGIRLANPGEPGSRAHYFQQYVEGPSFAALFCAYADRVQLLGVTEQLVGESWLHARPFHYCGSIGPVEVHDRVRTVLQNIGEVLHAGCGLRGLFGVDYILKGETPYVVEINPRYTASVEVHERASGLASFELHCAAFASGAHRPIPIEPQQVIGKAILFAPYRLKFPQTGPWQNSPHFADIPHPCSIIEQGWPILTMYAHGVNAAECGRNLRQRAAGVVLSS